MPTGLHTAAYTPKHGASLLRTQCGFALPAKSLLFHCAFIYIHFPVLCEPSPSAEEKKSAKMPPQLCPQPFLIPIFNFSHKWPTFAFTDENGYTHSALGERSHTAAHRAKQGYFGWGRYHYPRSVPHVHKHPRAGYQNGKLCRFWVLARGTLEERRGPAGQRCAYARRCPEGVAAPLGCVIFFRFCRNYGFHTLCSGLSACARHRRYHYPRRALRASETLDGRLSKRLTCRFLRSGSLH